MNKDFRAKNWKEYLPKPICNAEYEELYYKAWELARAHVKEVPGMPQSPYMDEAFCDTQIWIWDTCFMSLFCKFAPQVFPGVESLNNFYEVFYGGKKLPKIVVSENEPWWTGAVPGEKSDMFIHIADNPPLFAWSEYENALMSGDIAHIKTLLYENQYLQKHYEWFENLKEESCVKGVSNPTCLVAEELGYRWEGGRSGMDNTPRGRKAVRDGKERPNNPNMLWVDAICQQALVAKCIAKLFALVGDAENERLWKEKFSRKKEIVNTYYWDKTDKFYYDIDVNDHSFYKVQTIASYWALTAGIAEKEQAAALAKRLSDPETFGGNVPLISLAANDGDYHSDGRYWRGSLWLPTAYAALKGLSEYGFREETHQAACKILNHMCKTYREYEPHTIWECYAPEAATPAMDVSGKERVRLDFCGWSALGPIAIFLEYVLGFYEFNAFQRVIKWAKPNAMQNRIGVENLRFGDIVTDIISENEQICVISNGEYTLEINGKKFEVKKGENRFRLEA